MSFLEIGIIAAIALAVFWPGGKRKSRNGGLKWMRRKLYRPRTSTLPALTAEKEEEPAPVAAKPYPVAAKPSPVAAKPSPVAAKPSPVRIGRSRLPYWVRPSGMRSG